MNPDPVAMIGVYGLFVIVLFVCGLYYVMATRNLIRVIIGLELMMKGVTLLLLIAGKVSGHLALAQALIITVIVVEVVLVPVSAGLIYRIFAHNDSLDVTRVRKLQG